MTHQIPEPSEVQTHHGVLVVPSLPVHGIVLVTRQAAPKATRCRGRRGISVTQEDK